MKRLALYLHIPFCRAKCCYCDFNSYPGLEHLVPRYVRALGEEMALWQKPMEGWEVATVYFGGGTPSLLSSQELGDILGACHSHFTVAEDAEVTIEANPSTIREASLHEVRALGVNRLSLGAQSFSAPELKLLGRIHTAREAKESFRAARRAGFHNIGLDLIYGLPRQTVAAWRRSLEEALALAPEHLSLYCLSLEAGTPLAQAVAQGRWRAPDPDRAAAMYALAEGMLAEVGFGHYELSNWARPGMECRHNLTYWRNQPYLGLGAGAHSFLGGRRFWNVASPQEYIACLEGQPPTSPEAGAEAVSPALELAETLILGLRLVAGVDRQEVAARFGQGALAPYESRIRELAALGLLTEREGCVCLTPRGRLLANEVCYRFLPAPSREGVPVGGLR